jgi:hypothetical protein
MKKRNIVRILVLGFLLLATGVASSGFYQIPPPLCDPRTPVCPNS